MSGKWVKTEIMKREIKFRGKRIDNGAWVYGCLVNNLWVYNTNGISKIETSNGKKVFEIITGDYNGDCWEDIIDEEKTIVTVIPESVGQYTGLKDKNEKEIYEGDLIRGNHVDLFVIEAINGGLQMYNSKYYGQKHNELISEATCDLRTSLWLKKSTVVGNIYENPELLR